jgi:hypothetical protein
MAESARKSPEQEEAVRRDFRKGNINFDFLQPEGDGIERRTEPRGPDRRAGQREGKRGLFNRGRPPRPVGWMHVSAWAALLTVSVVATLWIVVLGDSVLWLLLLPFALSTGLWSVIMLVLFQSRPR